MLPSDCKNQKAQDIQQMSMDILRKPYISISISHQYLDEKTTDMPIDIDTLIDITSISKKISYRYLNRYLKDSSEIGGGDRCAVPTRTVRSNIA